MSGVAFSDTRRTIMKRDPSSGTDIMAAPVTLAYVILYVTNKTVAHNLGYVPIFRVYYEPFNNGVIWGCLSTRLSGRAQNPRSLGTYGPGIIAWADETNLYIQLYYVDATLTGTYPVYWQIYRDYRL